MKKVFWLCFLTFVAGLFLLFSDSLGDAAPILLTLGMAGTIVSAILAYVFSSKKSAPDLTSPVGPPPPPLTRSVHRTSDRDREIYILVGEEKKGPFYEQYIRDCVRTGAFGVDALAWHEGLPQWVSLQAIFPDLQTQDPDFRPLPVPEATKEYHEPVSVVAAESIPVKEVKTSGGGIWNAVVFLGVVVFLAWRFFLPSHERNPAEALELQNLRCVWAFNRTEMTYVPTVTFTVHNRSNHDLESFSLRATFMDGDTIKGEPRTKFISDLPTGMSNGPIELVSLTGAPAMTEGGGWGHPEDQPEYTEPPTVENGNPWRYQISCSPNIGNWKVIAEGNIEMPRRD